MQTPEQKTAIAVRVLGIGKRLAPDRFPAHTDRSGNIDRDLVLQWAKALGAKTYPLDLWEEAVEHWVNHIDHGRMATTGEILKAAKAVRQKWEDDPTRREQFKALYEAREAERERQWREGTLATTRGHKPAIQQKPHPIPKNVLNRLQQVAERKRA
ncbi:hypothetical protein [Corynebacterium liangguodongii]|uniref:hypothetical protein n=1 Tax=Corynebacterium liangguodongii TaxID=2079535 RepID=UPI0011B23054|nr:hypothetical protein [Corynebacterium liangguodongii]